MPQIREPAQEQKGKKKMLREKIEEIQRLAQWLQDNNCNRVSFEHNSTTVMAISIFEAGRNYRITPRTLKWFCATTGSKGTGVDSLIQRIAEDRRQPTKKSLFKPKEKKPRAPILQAQRCLRYSERLTKRELSFIANLCAQPPDYRVTPKQEKLLQAVAKKVLNEDENRVPGS